MTDRLSPPSDLRPEVWQELLAVTVEDLIREGEGFDAGMTAIEAGLSEEEALQFQIWVRKIEGQIEGRELRKEIGITTERMLEWIRKHPDEPLPET